ncbi:MAG: divalent metal cation transporter [Acidobacteria bacterium]|jgi:Mn2+/Fe2+ NRAMP family transporter|nr:MAG: divalent metal cation transporter [Acidobacteriota bacterium]
MKNRFLLSFFSGASFLMATSAVGPGFLNNTSKFTQDLLASFGFVILLSVILDIFAQLNIWRIIAITEKRAQDIANQTIKGSGYLLAFLVASGGLAFNIGNIGGAALGLNVLLELDLNSCALISAVIGIGVFLFKEAGKALDWFTRILGFVMIGLIVYVVWTASPPFGEALSKTIFPEKVDALATVALVGGTVGGYISFAGAHRLLDAGVSGIENLSEVNRSAISGILITALIRFLLFLAALGVIISLGGKLDEKNPAASVFQIAAGFIGYKIFGVVMFSAAITSVVGAAYTSVSFLKTFSDKVNKKERTAIISFITLSTLIFLITGQPAKVLVIVGVLNGFILPIALAIILVAARNKNLIGNYSHPLWLEISGWLVVAVMSAFSIYTAFQVFY